MTRRRSWSWATWVAALIVLGLVLMIPDMLSDEPWKQFEHLPIELPLFLLVPLLLPRAPALIVQAVLAFLVTVLTLIKIANIGIFAGFDRSFDPLLDPLLATTAIGTLARANIFLAVAACVAVFILVCGFMAILLWTGRVLTARAEASRALTMAVAILLTVAGVGLMHVRANDPPTLVTSANTALVARNQIELAQADLRDRNEFARVLVDDPLSKSESFAALKGVDVLLVFVESYGQTTLGTPEYADIIRPTLTEFESALMGAGFSSRSAWAGSPTFGGESWLAHSTVLSGAWIDNQRRYRMLMESSRTSLVGDFKRAGWRTVGVMPEITLTPWADAEFFGYDKFYGSPELNYAGAPFGYMVMPDQFTLAAFQRAELTPNHAPLMAQIALVSSHIPWAPLPKLLPWDQVGDGSVFTTARTEETAETVWSEPSRISRFYVRSIDYSLRALMSFVTAYGSDNVLLIILGDHQPMPFVAGDFAPHTVPIHIIAKNAALLDQLGEGWTRGMIPDVQSPVWPMDTIRAHIHAAFTSGA